MMTYHEHLADLSLWFWTEMANHLWQSTLFFLFVFLIAAVLRKARAKSRYMVWLLASIKFALPLSMFAAVGRWLNLNDLFLPACPVAESSAFESINFVNIVSSAPITGTALSTTEVAATGHNEIYCLLTLFWLIGCFSLFILWRKRSRAFKKSLGYRNTLTTGREAELLNKAQNRIGLKARVNFIISDSISEPLTLGIQQPTVVMPKGLSQKLTDEEFDSVLMHELAHIVRRDNLVAVLQMALCCLLWFHPLVWFVKRKMLDERELACDEAVIGHEHKPKVYISGLLKVVQYGLHSQQSAGVANAAGANLNKRMEIIMKNEIKNANAKWQKWVVGSTIAMFVLICVVSGFTITQAENRANTEPAAESIRDEQTLATKFQQVEIYAEGKLINTMKLRSPKPNLTMLSYLLYRIPEGQTAQTGDGQKIYTFQIIPTQQADSVKVEIVALLEDLSTASNAHPIYEFRRQTVANYSLRPGESAVVSEMSQLGVRPPEIKVNEYATEKESPKTDYPTKTVSIQKGEELPDVSYKIVGNDDSPLKITEATGPQITNALYTKLTGQTTVTTGVDGKNVFPNVYGAPVVKMINNSGKTITGFSIWVIDPRPNGEIRKTRAVIVGKPVAPSEISIHPGQSYTVNFRETHQMISEKYWLAEFTDPANFYVSVSQVQFDDGTTWKAKEFEK